MKIEAGKYYRARDGRKPHSVTESEAFDYFRAGDKQFDCKYGSGASAETRCVYEDGTHIFGRTDYDLVEEIGALTLQVGKHYKLRNGMVVGPLEHNNHRFGIRDYPFKAGQRLHEFQASSWTETGQFHRHGGMPQFDIVAEYVVPMTASPTETMTDRVERLDARMSAVENRLEGVDEDLEKLFETDNRLVKQNTAIGRRLDHMDAPPVPVRGWTPSWVIFDEAPPSPAAPKSFKLEYGKKYLDREGNVVGPLTPTDRRGFEHWPFEDKKTHNTYRPGGAHGYYLGEILKGDLVKEYVEPKPVSASAIKQAGDRVALFLSEAEAETLYRVLGRVSGDARTTRRGHMDAIRKALGKAGVQHDGKDDIRNVINFCNK